jgi:hypothetical protein
MEHPKLFERLQWLRNGDHCLRIKQEPLQFRPGHTTAKIEQPVEINGASTSTKLATAPSQQVIASKELLGRHNLRHRQRWPASHTNCPSHSRIKS